jgi:hypothetical protein
MVVMLRQCCCGCSLATGTIIIGIVETVSRPYTAIFSFMGTIDIDTNAISIQMLPEVIYVLHELCSGAFNTSDYVATNTRKACPKH